MSNKYLTQEKQPEQLPLKQPSHEPASGQAGSDSPPVAAQPALPEQSATELTKTAEMTGTAGEQSGTDRQADWSGEGWSMQPWKEADPALPESGADALPEGASESPARQEAESSSGKESGAGVEKNGAEEVLPAEKPADAEPEAAAEVSADLPVTPDEPDTAGETVAADKPGETNGKDAPDEDEDAAPGIPLLEHFRELRNRLIKSFLAVVLGFGVCWALRGYLVDFLYAPLLSALHDTGQPEIIIATGVAEKFLTYMKIAFVGGIFASSPLIFYQLWSFIAPGLYDEEKVFVVPVSIASAFFFILGGSFCYFVVLPNALPFLLGFGEEYMRDTPKMSEYFGFALQLLLAFGFIFEMPLFIFFLARLGVVTSKMLSKFRRYFIVIAFIAAAVLTPPDVMSQLLMAAPMLLLYEFSIIIAKFFGKERKKKADSTEGKEAEA